jgi:L-asparaginase II
MAHAQLLAEIWRGEVLESQHYGHAVVVDAGGEVLHAWGDPDKLILPRSSCKMVQGLPLVESGAADAHGLRADQLALACASHNGAAIHTDRVNAWLGDLGLGDDALRCGPQMPRDRDAKKELICSEHAPGQCHNNCSGKHSGFLTLNAHLGGGAEYLEIDHPVQKAVRAAFEEVTGETSPTYAIDGCSAPNHATSLTGLARAMAFFANAHKGSEPRAQAATRLREAMVAHPDLVAGEGRACTKLMRAMSGGTAVKTGAEGVFVAILPEQGLGIALKAADGTTRAAETAITALLVRLGALAADHPVAVEYTNGPITNWRGTVTGFTRASAALLES